MAIWESSCCKQILCDADLYYPAPGERRRSLKMKVKCPKCGKISILKDWIPPKYRK